MVGTLAFLAILALAGCERAAEPDVATPPLPPRLVVVVSVDQMIPEFLSHYGGLFQHGLRRLVDEGWWFTDASHDHALTVTAPGHATLVTGVHPFRSGIIANEWRSPDDGWARLRYAVEDTSAAILGRTELPGRSPANVLRTGLPGWLRLAHPEAKLVSLSRKDRSAITMGGLRRGQVYWMTDAGPELVTSTYYRDGYPEWVTRFNDNLPELLAESVWADSVWESEIPSDAPVRRADAAPYEGDGVHTAFPHRYADESDEAFGAWLADTPFTDRVVVSAAIAAIAELELGADDVPDYLALGLSATDYVGHDYGPWSHEQLDNLLRLDRELGRLLAELDERVGEGRWVLGFSADHGVMAAPEFLVEMGVPEAFRLASYNELRETATGAVPNNVFGPWVRTEMAAAVERLEYVADAMTREELLERDPPSDPFVQLYRNSYHPRRLYGPLGPMGVLVRLREHVIRSSNAATHGSPYRYDRAVPMIFLGAGVPTGSSAESVHTVSFAPTLATLAGIPHPTDLDGEPLSMSR